MREALRPIRVVCIALVALLGIASCNPFSSSSDESYKTAVLEHFGFDFSAGDEPIQYTNNDGEVIGWQPGGETHPQYPSGNNLWWRNDQVTEGTPNETRSMGTVGIESVKEAPATWEVSPNITPLLVGHVYVAKCRDGYVKFEVTALDLEDWTATVKYKFSSSASF
jgi:hypothetical protein